MSKQQTAQPPLNQSTQVMHQEMLSRALRFYWENLKSSIKARRYLKERGVLPESVARFGLGYADGSSQSLRKIFPNYHVPSLVESGLVVDGERGRNDRFRNRIIFPILNESGRVIAFGGRIIEGDAPKYLNSPQTPLFDKGATLFGLPQARMAIEETGAIVVVEGYLDVVILAQSGIENTVATLGTATTSAHVKKLIETARERVIFCFDGDDAGRKAAEKALLACADVIGTGPADVHFVFLPETEDPDSIVRSRGVDAFRDLLKQSVPFSDFLLEYLRSGKDMATCEGRAQLTSEAIPILLQLKDAALYYRVCEAIAKDSDFAVAEIITWTQNNTQRSWNTPTTGRIDKNDAQLSNQTALRIA